jgi:hypothetical protein
MMVLAYDTVDRRTQSNTGLDRYAMQIQQQVPSHKRYTRFLHVVFQMAPE